MTRSLAYNICLWSNNSSCDIDLSYVKDLDYLPQAVKANSTMCIGAAGMDPEISRKSEFQQTLIRAATKGVLHDCLEFNNGLSFTSVLSWKMMEWMPFRRMDLRPDGSWKAITFPLPRGEVRDMPENALIHHSAIQRMEADEKYRYVSILEKHSQEACPRMTPFPTSKKTDTDFESPDQEISSSAAEAAASKRHRRLWGWASGRF